ncbi:MAG: ABC transporter substrate-binding protein [Acidimicrobiia bacterium]|nr:ABC transporter substrate-binding protein [Acidimicrobiia bacterium]
MRRLVATVAVLGLLAAACGRSDDTASDDDDGGATTAVGAATTTVSAPEDGGGPGDFGDLGTVCGPAEEGVVLKATDVGVTADSIQLGTVADPGYAGRPGLNQEIFDSAEAFAGWCNAAGGISGRKIDVVERDAKLTEHQARMIDACEEGDFMLVGGLGVFDDQGQVERLACGLPAIAGSATNPPAADSDLMITPLPSDLGTLAIGDLRWLGEQFPEATKKIGILTAGVAVTLTSAEKAKEAMRSLGWEIVYDEKYNAAGEASWRGFAEGMKSAGVRGVIWVADPGNLAALLKSMDEIEFKPDFVRAGGNSYDNLLLAEAGSAADGVYMASSHYPYLDPEIAAQNPATQQFLDIMDEFNPGGKIANLGVTGFSAWLLFAKAASACGADLTRDCVWEQAEQIGEWSGGGLHARTEIVDGVASQCFVEIAVEDGDFVVVDTDPNEGIFSCDPENVFELTGDYGEGVKCANPAFADDPEAVDLRALSPMTCPDDRCAPR